MTVLSWITIVLGDGRDLLEIREGDRHRDKATMCYILITTRVYRGPMLVREKVPVYRVPEFFSRSTRKFVRVSSDFLPSPPLRFKSLRFRREPSLTRTESVGSSFSSSVEDSETRHSLLSPPTYGVGGFRWSEDLCLNTSQIEIYINTLGDGRTFSKPVVSFPTEGKERYKLIPFRQRYYTQTLRVGDSV